MTEAGDRFAGARTFPSTLPAPSTGGGAELGELVQLYGKPAGSWPVPADAPAPPPAPHGINAVGRWVGLSYDGPIITGWAALARTEEEVVALMKGCARTGR